MVYCECIGNLVVGVYMGRLFVYFSQASLFSRRDVDQYYYALELTVYLKFCLVGSSLPMLYVLKTHSCFVRQISAARVGIE